MMDNISFVAAVVLPLWNIPLIWRMIKRRSSADVSLMWAWGVWGCLLAMFPAGLRTSDAVFKVFTIVNFIFFTGVVGTAAVLRRK
jgi:hypothetical protein